MGKYEDVKEDNKAKKCEEGEQQNADIFYNAFEPIKKSV